MAKTIIDISEHQKKINFVALKEAYDNGEIDGIIIRIGYGDDLVSQDDDYVKYNLDEVERLGIPYEVYFYSYAACDAQIQSEIAHIKRLIGGRDVRVWLDLEYRPAESYWRRMTEAFLKAFPSGGVYSWEWCFTDVLDGIDCPRWICAYGKNTGKPQHDKKPSISCHGWQYTSRAKMSGINGYVDASLWYGDFAEAPAGSSTTSDVGRNDIVNQMLEWEHYSEADGRFKVIIDGYNDYLPTAVKAGCANYNVKYTDEWCATAASYAYIACGIGYMFPVECSCPRMITLAKKMGIWQEADDYIPDPADAILYDWEDSGRGDNTGTPDHIGIVIAVDKAKGTFVVMEGNYNERVARRTMKIDGKFIRGYICPKFSTTASTTKPASTTVPTTAPKKTSDGYEISGTGTPSKKVLFTGILKKSKNVTARRQPKVSAKPCSFSVVKGLTRISVCDYITTDKKWAYCCVGGKYGYILNSSILDYVRNGGQSINKVAQWVLDDDFGTKETRRKCLEELGYDYDAVQKVVTEKVRAQEAEEAAKNPLIRLYAPRFWENNEKYYGDETIFIEGKQGVIFDTGMNGSLAVSKAKALGLEEITIVITHPHGDHTGNVRNMVDALPVKKVIFPNVDGIRKYQKSYAERMDSLASYCKKEGVAVTWVKMGDSFSVGSLKVDCLFQANADKLKEKDDHHFINNMSMVYKVFAGGWRILIGGDLSAEGILLMMAAGVDYACDIFKFFWHGDRGAIKTAFATSIKGVLIAFTQYEKAELKSNGRADTYGLLRNIGAFVVRAYEDGEIYIDMQGSTAKLTTSKGITRTFVKKKMSYKVCLTTKATPAIKDTLLPIEPEDYTNAEIKALKAAGNTLLAYLNVGALEDDRPYYKTLESYTLRRLDNWEHERYLDVCEAAVQDWIINQGMRLLNAGYDGLWIDNIDVYEEYPSTTAYNGITRILQAFYPHGYIMINGGKAYMSRSISEGLHVAHGVNQEEVFSLITDYDGKGTFGRQDKTESIEYQKYISSVLNAGMDAFLMEYTEDNSLKQKIINYCEASGAGYYISEDVDL